MAGTFRIEGVVDNAHSMVLLDEFRRRGWRQTTGEDWDLLWSARIPTGRRYRLLKKHQRINHYPGALTLHLKDEFSHFVESAGFGDIVPRTYTMPRGHAAWRKEASDDRMALWVAKPTGLSCGRGVQMIIDGNDFRPLPGSIVQRYIADPLLLPDRPYKHSLRRYVAITSLDPLEAHHHTEGPVKFTSRPYSRSQTALADPVVHFTNPQVQRTNRDVHDPVRSISTGHYRRLLSEAGIDHLRLWRRLDAALARAVAAHAEPVARISRNLTPHLDRCFELLGFDVVIDANLDPWLVECNVSPALAVRGDPGSPTHDAQRHAKATLIADLFTLIGIEGRTGSPVSSDHPGWTRLETDQR